MLVFLYFNLQQKGAEHHTFCRVVKGVHQVCIARSLMKLRERAMQSLTISNFDHTAEGVMFCPLFSEVEVQEQKHLVGDQLTPYILLC